MSQTFRHPDILEIAKSEGKVTVDDLAKRFGVSVQTIRRDLSDMASARKLERVHGGAVLPSGTINLGYEERRSLNHSAKAKIARNCARTIPEGASVCLAIGTTTEAVARELLDHRNLLVVTNNTNVASILSANTSCEVILTGGVLRPSDGGLVGSMTINAIHQFKFDIAVIGCSALDADGDLLDFDLQEVNVSKAILQHSRQKILVADHSKFFRNAPSRISSLAQIDAFFTDLPLSDQVNERCHGWRTVIHHCH